MLDNSLSALREKEGAERFRKELESFRNNSNSNSELGYVNSAMKQVWHLFFLSNQHFIHLADDQQAS